MRLISSYIEQNTNINIYHLFIRCLPSIFQILVIFSLNEIVFAAQFVCWFLVVSGVPKLQSPCWILYLTSNECRLGNSPVFMEVAIKKLF